MSNLKRWPEMDGEPKQIIACGDRWREIAASIGCTVHGFNDDFHASFFTPDGNVIEVGPKFRAMLAARQAPAALKGAE